MFSNVVRLFSICGFDVKLDPSWVLIASLLTWSLSQVYFPSVVPEAPPSMHLVLAFVALAGFFASLLLHEIAHALTARKLGAPFASSTLYLFGGVAEQAPGTRSPGVDTKVALAGPVMSFALACVFWLLTRSAEVSAAVPATAEIFSILAKINLALGVFNLVPGIPLDGGHVLRAFLWHQKGDRERATVTATRFGTAVAYTLMAIGVLALFRGAVIAAFWLILLGVYLQIAAQTTPRTRLTRPDCSNRTVREIMRRDPITVAPEMTLAEFVNQIMLRHGINFVPVVENGVLLGHIDQAMLSEIDRENWASTRIDDVFASLEDSVAICPEMPAMDLMDTILESGRRKFLVVSDQQLAGVVSLADLVRIMPVPHISPASW